MPNDRRARAIPLVLLVVIIVAGGAWWRARGQRAAARPLVYVALGASDAVGVGAAQPAREGWVPRVQAGLPAGARLVNLGINGATLADVLRAELPVALDAQPRLVTFWPGVNDIRAGVPLATFAAQLEQLLAAFDGDGATVALLNIPDLRALPAFDGQNPAALADTVAGWNAAIASAAARHGALVVDLSGASLELEQHPDYVSGDGFHPSSAGYRRIADLTLAALGGRLGVRA